MAGLLSDSDDGTGVGAGCGLTIDAPRGVKVFGIISFVLALPFVILHLAGDSLGGYTP